MSGFLVDTNVISEFIKPRPDSRVIRWLDSADPETLFVSVITFGEIVLGIQDLPAGKRRRALEEWVDQGLPAWFESHLLPVTKAVAERWGRLTIESQEEGVCSNNGRRLDCCYRNRIRPGGGNTQRDRFWRLRRRDH